MGPSDKQEENPEASPTSIESGLPEKVIERVAQETSTDRHTVEHVIEVVQQEIHRGPLPTPETFAQYERIYPGAAREIIGMAVRAQQHAHAMQAKSLDSEVGYRRLSIVLAASLVGLMIFGAIVCAITDHDAAAMVLGGSAALTGVAGVFIRGRDLFGSSKPFEISNDGNEPENGDPADVSRLSDR